MNKKLKKVIIVLLILVVIGVAGFFIIRNIIKPVVNDYTEQGNLSSMDTEGVENSDEEIEENSAKLSSLVKVIGEENANNVNAGIVSLVTNSDSTISMTLNSTASPEFENYEKGDIFILDGNSETPFGEVYIGKIVSKSIDSSGNLVIKTENPTLDEVFDEVHINNTTLLTEENINNIATIDGVSVRFVDDLETEMTEVSSQENSYNVTYLDNINYDDAKLVETADIATANASFVIEIDTGLEYDFTTKQLTTKAKADITNEVNADLLNGYKQYSEDNSESYSYENKTEAEKAADTGSADISSKLELGLSGKVGIENLSSTLDFDFDIFKGGVQDLSWAFGGKVVTSFGIDGKYEGKIGGEGTSNTFGDENIYAIKCEGLSKKTFPIAYIDFTGTTLQFDQVYSGISFIPVACGVMIYSDIEGNITVSFSTSVEYSNEFNYKLTVFEDGKLCSDMLDFTTEQTGKAEFKFSAKLYTDFTFLGFSGLITVCNINVLEIGLIDLGVEAEAEFSVNIVSNLTEAEDGSYSWVKDEENSSMDASGYLRGYFKLAELKLRLKLTSKGVDEDSWLYLNKDFTYDFTTIDLTLFELGTKTSTTYDDGSMEYSLVTASDNNFEYYKEYSEKTSSSKLIKRNEALQTQELDTDGDFIGICGIDEGYVYVFKTGASGGYDVYRVSKDGNTEKNKVVISGADTILLEDEKNFYYVDKDDTNKIITLDRGTLKTETLQEFEDGLKPFYMEESGTNFYVACEDTEDTWSWIFGEAAVEYYYVNESSSDVLPAESLFTKPSKYSYSVSSTIVGKTLLRGTASSYYINTPAGSTQINTTVGWNELNDGVFTVEEENGVNTMYLYSATDGSKNTLIEVNNGNALWTVVKGSDGYYYFLDQDTNGVGLYRLDISTSTKILVKQYEDFNIDLNDCGVAKLGSTLFFYEMPDDYTLNVNYRYTIY